MTFAIIAIRGLWYDFMFQDGRCPIWGGFYPVDRHGIQTNVPKRKAKTT